MPICFS